MNWQDRLGQFYDHAVTIIFLFIIFSIYFLGVVGITSVLLLWIIEAIFK